jgi:hypothetical protein
MEHIKPYQELRRGVFLSRWLMKDYLVRGAAAQYR